MSDLISRSELLKVLSNAEDNYRAEMLEDGMNDDPFSDGIMSAMFSVFTMINNQPTAYDIDKVVEKLQSEVERWEDSGVKYGERCEIAVARGLRNAIKIVKKGGISDDVCEWKIDGVYLHSTHNRPFVTCIADDEDYRYNFCPVCGKKIKAVE